MQEKIYLDKELDKFMSKLKSGENFTLLRFADGERAVMENARIQGVDGWHLPGKSTSLGEALREALQLKGENVYYGISCPCCDREAYYWYMSRIPNRNNITFSNIFVNRNYRKFLAEFKTLRRDAVVIANHRWWGGGQLEGLNVLQHYPVGDECVDFWEKDAQSLIAHAINDFGSKNGLLYVVSAGPMSEPIIAALYKNNPNNCYIDFGSSIDIYIHGKDTRPYSKPGTQYSERNCWMFDPKTTNFDVSVVLTAYKKPDALSLQLEAVENQTLKPREIILYQDGIDGNYEVKFKPELLGRFSSTFISPSNKGVWERFKLAEQAASEYVCVFDDDTIPGKRWLENCHFNAQLQDGVYGAIGVIVENPQNYPRKFWRIGWARPYRRTARVDFVGHSWFLKREYLSCMFDGTEKYQSFKIAGEDMCISFKSLQHGIKTFVPQHPYSNTEMWGSLPEYALKYGTDHTAVSLSSAGTSAMTEAMKMFAAEGWSFCKDEPDSHLLRVRIGSKLGYYMTRRKVRKLIDILRKCKRFVKRSLKM